MDGLYYIWPMYSYFNMCQPKEDGLPRLSLVPPKVSSFTTLLIMLHFLFQDVPPYYIREFFLATVAFWLAHWGIKAQHLKKKFMNVFFYNKLIQTSSL